MTTPVGTEIVAPVNASDSDADRHANGPGAIDNPQDRDTPDSYWTNNKVDDLFMIKTRPKGEREIDVDERETILECELVFNGEVIASIPFTGDRTRLSFERSFRPAESGWYHVRVNGARDRST